MNNTVLCKSVASYKQADALQKAVESIFSASENVQALTPQSKVLIKPNLLAKHVPEAAVTTHPAMLKAAIVALQARGVSHITVADSSGGVYTPSTMKAIYKASGLAAVCAETGAVLYTECNARPRKTDGVRVREFNLIDPVHEADFILNMPKLKTHVMTGMSCAVKNLFGTIPGLQKAELHMRFSQPADFGEMLVDLCECLRPQLHLVDGIVAMEGDGPAGGVPRPAGLVLGSENPYYLDLFVCHLFSLPVARVPYLAAAVARGLCPAQADLAWVQADADTAQPLPHWLLPHGGSHVSFDSNVPPFLRPAVHKIEAMVAPHPKVKTAHCVGCGKCAEICPGNTIVIKNKKARIVPQHCIRCFCCHEMCPVKAIDVKRFGVFRL